GDYDLTPGSLDAGPDYSITVTGVFHISPAPLSITAQDAVKLVGTADPALTYTATGLLNGDSLSGALSRDSGEDAGTYAITQGSLDAGPNYAVTFEGADFQILDHIDLTVTAISAAKVYGAADPELGYTVDGLISGVNLTGSLGRDAGEVA